MFKRSRSIFASIGVATAAAAAMAAPPQPGNPGHPNHSCCSCGARSCAPPTTWCIGRSAHRGARQVGLEPTLPGIREPGLPTAAELRGAWSTWTTARWSTRPRAAASERSTGRTSTRTALSRRRRLIPGWEYLALPRRRQRPPERHTDGAGARRVRPAHAVHVTGTSSGSRGVYGAIATAGEWGLKRGCAVAYADKGSGNGLHELVSGAVQLIDGVPTPRGRHEAIPAHPTPRGARGVQRGVPEPCRVQARALAAESGSDWGPPRCRRSCRVLRAEQRHRARRAAGQKSASSSTGAIRS